MNVLMCALLGQFRIPLENAVDHSRLLVCQIWVLVLNEPGNPSIDRDISSSVVGLGHFTLEFDQLGRDKTAYRLICHVLLLFTEILALGDQKAKGRVPHTFAYFANVWARAPPHSSGRSGQASH